MDLAEARQFLATHHCAVLATRRRDGRLQMSPITVGVDAAGRAIISSRETAYKTRHLRRDPRASLCVFMDEFYGPWVQIDGTAEVVSLPDAMELAGRLLSPYRWGTLRLGRLPPCYGA